MSTPFRYLPRKSDSRLQAFRRAVAAWWWRRGR